MPKFLARPLISGLAGRVGLAWTMLVVTAGGALAQSDHGAAHGGDAAQGAEHASGGLPQLNPDFFSPQLIWLGISFITLYYLMSKVALPLRPVSTPLSGRADSNTSAFSADVASFFISA